MTIRLLTAVLSFIGVLAAQPRQALILTGASDEPYHHWRETTDYLQRTLAAGNRFDVRVISDPTTLTKATLQSVDVIVLNYNGPRFPVAVESAIEDFVNSGGGFAAFHQAAYGAFFGMQFQDKKWRQGPEGSGWNAFSKMVGETWETQNIGHARRCEFLVEWKESTHPAFMADDELYHKITLFPGVNVLADALSPLDKGGTGKREPLFWTNQWGRGRVFFTTLGHDVKAWSQPGMSEAFLRGVEWAAQRKGARQ